MTALTPERLAEIRWRSTTAMQAYSTGAVGTTPMDVGGVTINEALDLVGESAEDVPDLLAEIDRLRSGIAALADWHETKAEKAARFRPEINGENRVMDKAAQVHRDADSRLRALLNPTEGEDDG